MKILGLIPARSGSKGIPNKNILPINGHPLMSWSIQHAKGSRYIDRVIVSTDDSKYAEIANRYGAETPFLRPPIISDDLSTDYECFKHCIDWFIDNDPNNLPDIIVQLRPTTPIRDIGLIDEMIKVFIENMGEYDSLRTVVEMEKSPYKMYSIKDSRLIPLFDKVDGIKEPYNQCRQILPKTYLHNGYIDIVKTDTVLKKGSVTGDKIYPYIMKEGVDIDDKKDWDKASSLMNHN